MELEDRWSELEEEQARRGFLIFPNPPVEMTHNAEDFRPSPLAMWPEDGSLEEFLNLASALGVRLLYAWPTRFEPEDMEDLLAATQEIADEWNEGFPTQPRQTIDPAIRDLVGRVRCLDVQFYFGGVFHAWQETASWSGRVQVPDRPATEPLNIGALVTKYADKITEWADQVAQQEEFQRAPRGPLRQEVAIRLIPELTELREKHGERITRLFGYSLAEAGRKRYLEVVVPEQERALARQGRTLMARGLTKTEAAAQLGMGKGKLDRLLGQYRA